MAAPAPAATPADHADKRRRVIAALKEGGEKLDEAIGMIVASGQPAHHPENPAILMMFFGVATQVSQKYGFQLSDLKPIQDEFKDDEEVQKLAAEFEERITNAGLPIVGGK